MKINLHKLPKALRLGGCEWRDNTVLAYALILIISPWNEHKSQTSFDHMTTKQIPAHFLELHWNVINHCLIFGAILSLQSIRGEEDDTSRSKMMDKWKDVGFLLVFGAAAEVRKLIAAAFFTVFMLWASSVLFFWSCSAPLFLLSN